MERLSFIEKKNRMKSIHTVENIYHEAHCIRYPTQTDPGREDGWRALVRRGGLVWAGVWAGCGCLEGKRGKGGGEGRVEGGLRPGERVEIMERDPL